MTTKATKERIGFEKARGHDGKIYDFLTVDGQRGRLCGFFPTFESAMQVVASHPEWHWWAVVEAPSGDLSIALLHDPTSDGTGLIVDGKRLAAYKLFRAKRTRPQNKENEPANSELELLDRIRELRRAEAEAFANYVKARDAFNKAFSELRIQAGQRVLKEDAPIKEYYKLEATQ